MDNSFIFELWNQSRAFRGITFVILTIGFFWALIYSKFNRTIRFALRGALLMVIITCIILISEGGISPNNSNPLAILGIAIICLSIVPKPPEEEGDNDHQGD